MPKKRTTSAVIRIKPFQLDVRITRTGFTLEFRGLTRDNQVVEAHLEFPSWWIAPLQDKVARAIRRRKAR